MARGYPDWRPPSAPGAFDITVLRTNALQDLVASPGAGFRLVLYGYMAISDATAGLYPVDEVTPANVFVRALFKGNGQTGNIQSFDYGGVPLGEANKIRMTTAPANFLDIHISTRTEAI